MTSKNGAKQPILEVRNLHASVAGTETEILKGLDLTVNLGEVHAIMGPNGSGKSTLVSVIAGRPEFEVTSGEISYMGKDLTAMLPEERAREGIFLAFQYPMELPGVRPWQFLKAAVDAVRKHQGLPELSIRDFDQTYKAIVKEMGLDPELLKRSLNEGFSGGEKKRNEMVQLALLNPRLALLDETDSGLDIDALKTVAEGVNKRRSPERAILLVTHYQRLLNYITPDHVHVLVDGRIAMSGGADLAHQLEAKGYDWVKETAGSR
ncbi:MAG: Fe-S cluster assembly ATPase SufC [SAR202 cluster bacterium]|nr:Fe-S cluster assembly ATPase SufC [SAR202 cluster bacterium]